MISPSSTISPFSIVYFTKISRGYVLLPNLIFCVNFISFVLGYSVCAFTEFTEKLLTTILEMIAKTITFFNLFLFFKNNIENKLNPAIPINPVIGDISPVLTLLFISFGLSSLGLIVTFPSLLSTITLYSFISFAFNNGILNTVFSLEDNCFGSDTFTSTSFISYPLVFLILRTTVALSSSL